MCRAIKRFMVILAVFAFCAFAGAAFADTVPADWAELAEAVNGGGTSVILTLDSDVTAPDWGGDPLVVPAGKTVTINLNGHTLSRGTYGLGRNENVTLRVSAGAVCVLNGPGTFTDEDAAGVNAYRLIENAGTLTLSGADLRSNSMTVKNTGTMTLDGGSLFSAGGANAVVSEGADALFTLEDGAIDGITSGYVDAGAVEIVGGRFVMNGGSISDNACIGAPVNNAGGTVVINGGSISGNTSSDGPGAIRNNPSYTGGSAAGGNLTINGGTISGNTGKTGAVLVMSGSAFTMTGGSITGNTSAKKDLDKVGGAVCFGPVSLSGDIRITGNTRSGREGAFDLVIGSESLPVSVTGKLSANARVGLNVEGTIYSGKAATDGLAENGTRENLFLNEQPEYGWVFFNEDEGEYCAYESADVRFQPGEGTGTMENASFPVGYPWMPPDCAFTVPAEPEGCVFGGWEYSGRVYEPGTPITVTSSSPVLTARWLSPWGAAKKAIENRGTQSYTLTRDLTAASWDGPITVSKDLYTSKSVDLNGFTMDASALPESVSYFFKVESGMSFTIRDSGGGGKLTGATSDDHYPVEVEGTLFLKGGNITGNLKGGVKCGSADASGTVRIEGGKITGNGTPEDSTSTDGAGVGVNIQKGTLYLESGEISGNTTGISTGSQSVYMSGGSVSGNRGYGIMGAGSAYLSGGTITGNAIGLKTSGGVYVSGMLTVSGNGIPGVSGRDLYLNQYQVVHFRGPLDAEARIGVVPYGGADLPCMVTDDLRYNGQVCAVPENFFCAGKMIGKTRDTSGHDRLIVTYGVTVSYDANGGSGGNHPEEIRAEGISWNLPECTFTAPAGKLFDAWQVSGSRYPAGAPVSVSADTVVKALWTDQPPMTFAEMQELLDAGGEITLVRNVTGAANEQYLTAPAGKAVTLDLNGHTVGRSGTSESFTLVIPEQAELTILDSSQGGTGTITGEGSETLDCIRNRGILTLQGGNVSGNCHGGIDNYGTFTMSGGKVTGNGHSASGSGTVSVAVTNRAGGVFTMTGGSVTGNTGDGVWNLGTFVLDGGTVSLNTYGGVRNLENGEMTMSSGSISQNGGTDKDYSGLDISGGTVLVTGGTIERNTSLYGTVRIGGGSLTMTGGSVTNNRTFGVSYTGGTFAIGGDVYFGNNINNTDPWYSGDVYMTAGKTIGIVSGLDGNRTVRIRLNEGSSGPVIPITSGYLDGDGNPRAVERYFVDVTGAYGRGMKDGEMAFTLPPSSWTELQQEITGVDAGSSLTVRLASDVVCENANDEALTIPNGKSVILDLNGHTLDRNGMNTKRYQTVLVNNGAELTIRDSSTEQTGKVTGEHSPDGTGYPCIVNNGILTLESGSIEGNYNGGVENKGTFTMKGGNITGNGHSEAGSTGASQSGVRNDGTMYLRSGTISGNLGTGVTNTGTFWMQGGEISGNTISGVGNYNYNSNAVMNMTAGTISGNSSAGSTRSGSAISNTAAVTMTGGTITGNAGLNAVDVSGQGSSFTMTGGTIVNNGANGIVTQNGGTLTLGGSYIRINGNGSANPSDSYDIGLGLNHRIHFVDLLSNAFSSRVKLLGNPPTGGAVIPITEGRVNGSGVAQAGVNNFTDASGVYRTVVDGFEIAFTDEETPAERSDWEKLQDRIDSMGTATTLTLTLSADVVCYDDEEEPLTIPAGKHVTLDLNGKKLNRNWKNSIHPQAVVVREGAELTIRDSSSGQWGSVTGEHDQDGIRPAVLNCGTLRLESGWISENYSGGVENHGTFYMSGGRIASNGPSGADGPGGSRPGVDNDGSLYMTGGLITSNIGYGVWNNGYFSMNGGEVTDNWFSGVYNNRTEADGVSVNAETDLAAGSIRGNGNYNSGQIGSGIYNLGTVRMTGGSIRGNYGPSTVELFGANSSFTMTGGTIAENHGAGITAQSGTIALGGNVSFYSNSGGSYFHDVSLGAGNRIHLISTLGSGSILVRLPVWISKNGTTTVTFTEGYLDDDGNPRAGMDTFNATQGGLRTVVRAGELAFTCLDEEPSGTMDEPDFVLPDGIRTIEAGAFEGIAAEVIALPEKEEGITVAAGAFTGCENLRQIFLPANVTVAEGAFDAERRLTIFGYAGTSAEDYANSHSNITFVPVGD